MQSHWRAWVTQSVKHQTLGFGLNHDLMVCEFEPHIGLCVDSVSLLGILSLPLLLCPSPTCMCTCALSKCVFRSKALLTLIAPSSNCPSCLPPFLAKFWAVLSLFPSLIFRDPLHSDLCFSTISVLHCKYP